MNINLHLQRGEYSIMENRNETYNITSVLVYLIGTDEKNLLFYKEKKPLLFEKLYKHKAATAIRLLNTIRSNLMLYYSETDEQLIYQMIPLYKQNRYKTEINRLRELGIDIIKPNSKCDTYLDGINKEITKLLSEIKTLFPEWLKWSYIKELFIMPDIKKSRIKFTNQTHLYPYRLYINWQPSDEGNVLRNDAKFVKILYEKHGEQFKDLNKVYDISHDVETNIYDFIDRHSTINVVVDCENSDALKLASVLTQLDATELKKINKIVLIDDINTAPTWEYLSKISKIPTEHIVIPRINTNKSLVDIKICIEVTRSHYKENVEAFILLSSDSDFWGLISALPDADFIVMLEREKCGKDIIRALDENKTYYCFIDDFCTGNINKFKDIILTDNLKTKLQLLIQTNLNDIFDEIIAYCRLNLSKQERNEFFKKYKSKIRFKIDQNGNMTITLE